MCYSGVVTAYKQVLKESKAMYSFNKKNHSSGSFWTRTTLKLSLSVSQTATDDNNGAFYDHHLF